MRIASALTKPVITERGTNRISFATPRPPSTTWTAPARTVAASRYSTPCSLTSETTTSAIAPVAAEIIAGRPPVNAIATAIVNDAYRPTLGSTPAMIENEIASGISASATTRPASSSTRSTPADGSGGRGRRGRAGSVKEDMKALFRFGATRRVRVRMWPEPTAAGAGEVHDGRMLRPGPAWS